MRSRKGICTSGLMHTFISFWLIWDSISCIQVRARTLALGQGAVVRSGSNCSYSKICKHFSDLWTQPNFQKYFVYRSVNKFCGVGWDSNCLHERVCNAPQTSFSHALIQQPSISFLCLQNVNSKTSWGQLEVQCRKCFDIYRNGFSVFTK